MRQYFLFVVFFLLIAGQVSAQDQIFFDDFETGDTSAWSSVINLSCDDGYSCTDDSFVAGHCVNTPNHGVCSNGIFCDGAEICDAGDPGADPLTGCVSGTAPTCDDGVACTSDTCDGATDSCVNLPNHSLCACSQSCDPVSGCGNWASIVTCSSQTYECGNTLDDDGDCLVDDLDAMCLGPCDDDEGSLDLSLPGSPPSCMSDCFFDGDYGSGDDDCFWSHECDPLQIAPNYDPEGPGCEYDPGANLSGTTMTCAEAAAFQSASCLDACLPLTPNGCDCFGCCEIAGSGEFFWLGSTDGGSPSCTLDTLWDPTACKPCTPVMSCYNSCEECEICVGKPTLPAQSCGCQVCPPGAQLCGPPCGTRCPTGFYCNSGCCTAEPS